MVGLGVVSRDFPLAGSAPGKSTAAALKSDAQHPVTHHGVDRGTCECPKRSAPPERPKELPLEPSVKNIPGMKAWLLKTYAASAFNRCPHQPLPAMKGPPLEIHLKPDAIPRRISTPATIPLHWQDKVKADLDRDVALGVIEPV